MLPPFLGNPKALLYFCKDAEGTGITLIGGDADRASPSSENDLAFLFLAGSVFKQTNVISERLSNENMEKKWQGIS